MEKFLFFKNDWHGSNEFFDFFSLNDIGFKNSVNFRLRNALVSGLEGMSFFRQLLTAEGVNNLYLNNDPRYFQLCENLLKYSEKYSAIVMFDFNFLHPEIVKTMFSGKKLILSFVDDPYSTYNRGLPYINSFDGSIFISPTYIDGSSMEDFLVSSTSKPVTWFPMVKPSLKKMPLDILLANKNNKLMYIGAPTHDKYSRLIGLYQKLGNNFELYGRWPLNGMYGFVAPLFNDKFFPKRIKKIPSQQAFELLTLSLGGLNMHCSGINGESGNIRTYEIAANACLAINLQKPSNEKIFPIESGVYNTSVEDIVLNWHDIKARPNFYRDMAAYRYEFFWEHYNPNKVFGNLYDWVQKI